MRTTIAILLSIYLAGCSKGANEGAEAAKKEAEKEQKEKEKSGGVAQKINPPVAGRAKLDCANLINAEMFQQALGEKEPITVVPSGSEPDAAASCSLVRGGKKLTAAEQAAKLKKEPRLGVLPGDEICNVSTFCWTIEDPERFRKKCAEIKDKDDDSLGFYSCVMIVAQGADDVKRFRFFDDDTKCIIQVRGGPSNVDNDLIGKCAKTAHDLIGPEQIKVGAAPGPDRARWLGLGLVRLALTVVAACGSSSAPAPTAPAKPAAPTMTAVSATASLEIASEEVTFGNGVPGTLTHPTTGGPYAGLVLMAGSGPTDRDWNSALLPSKNGSGKLLAEALAKHGVVVLRFDKAGVGGNKADLTSATFDIYRDEGQAALACLRSRKDVAPTKLFIAGHSEGGIHAMRTAVAEGDHIAGLLLLSASARSMSDLILAQLEPQLRGAIPDRADAELASIRAAFADFAAGKPVDPTKVTAIVPVQQLVRAVVNPATATLARGLVTFDPLPVVAQVHVPIFVYGGMKDVQVDPELDAKKLAAANKGATLFIAPEANHVLKHETKTMAELRANMLAVQTSYNADDRTLDDATVAAIVGWLATATAK